MKMARSLPAPSPGPENEIAQLRARLAEAEETLRAIRRGEVDAVVVTGTKGTRVFTLEGVGHAYRMLIESMNEGALILTTDKVILYANQCFARMVKCPLEQVTGSSFRRFLSPADRVSLRTLMKQAVHPGFKMQALLAAGDGSRLPAQISIRELPKDDSNRVIVGMVVTDLTEARRTEELLRALNQRVVQVQETERERVALELHDNITQLLCAVVFRSQVLVEELSARAGPAREEAVKLRDMLGAAAREVERISSDLRPGELGNLGLAAVLHETSTRFTERTGVTVNLANMHLTERISADIELALYRIFQEALKNVEQHARARHVTVGLWREDAFVHLTVKDDGIGFDPYLRQAGQRENLRLGLLGMRERANYVNGSLVITSTPRASTEIAVCVPLPPATD